MRTIEKLWFDSERIWIQTDDLQKFSRPLEAFPTLKEASNEERMSALPIPIATVCSK